MKNTRAIGKLAGCVQPINYIHIRKVSSGAKGKKCYSLITIKSMIFLGRIFASKTGTGCE